jgi:hypothetical protein
MMVARLVAHGLLQAGEKLAKGKRGRPEPGIQVSRAFDKLMRFLSLDESSNKRLSTIVVA